MASRSTHECYIKQYTCGIAHFWLCARHNHWLSLALSGESGIASVFSKRTLLLERKKCCDCCGCMTSLFIWSRSHLGLMQSNVFCTCLVYVSWHVAITAKTWQSLIPTTTQLLHVHDSTSGGQVTAQNGKSNEQSKPLSLITKLQYTLHVHPTCNWSPTQGFVYSGI